MPSFFLRISSRSAIAAAFLLRGFVQGSWYPRIPEVVSQVDLKPAQLGFVFFLAAVGNIIAFSVAARLITRIGSPRTLMLFAVPFALVLIVLSQSSSEAMFATGILVFGLLAGGFDISSSVQGAVVERQTHRPIMSALFGLFSVGALVGSLSSGLMAQSGIPMFSQFFVIGAVAIPVIIVSSMSMLPDDVVPSTRTPHNRRLPSLPPRALVPLGLMIVCIAIGEETINNWVALYMRDDLGANPAVAGFAFTAFAISTALGRLVGDVVLARFGVDRTLKTGSIIASAGLAFGVMVNQPWSIILGYTLMGVGLSVVVPVSYRRANDIPGIPRASAVATVASIGFVGFLVGPLIIGFITSATSLRISLALVSVVLLGIYALAQFNPYQPIVPETDEAASMAITQGEM